MLLEDVQVPDGSNLHVLRRIFPVHDIISACNRNSASFIFIPEDADIDKELVPVIAADAHSVPLENKGRIEFIVIYFRKFSEIVPFCSSIGGRVNDGADSCFPRPRKLDFVRRLVASFVPPHPRIGIEWLRDSEYALLFDGRIFPVRPQLIIVVCRRFLDIGHFPAPVMSVRIRDERSLHSVCRRKRRNGRSPVEDSISVDILQGNLDVIRVRNPCLIIYFRAFAAKVDSSRAAGLIIHMNCDCHFGSHPPYLHLATSNRSLLLALEGYRNRASLSSVILGNHHEALLSHGRDEVRRWQLGGENIRHLSRSIGTVVIYDHQSLASSGSAREQLIHIACAHRNASHVPSNCVWCNGSVNRGLTVRSAVRIQKVIYSVNLILVVNVFPVLFRPGFRVSAGYGEKKPFPRSLAFARIGDVDRAGGGCQHGGNGNV